MLILDRSGSMAGSALANLKNGAKAFIDIIDEATDGAQDGQIGVVISDKAASCFRITSADMPTKGTASLLDSNTVQWTIDELGVTQTEAAVLEFTVEHIGPCSGTVEVNEHISYDDADGNTVTFPSPELEVDCGIIVHPEDCPEPVSIDVDGCEDSLEFDAGAIGLESLGRIIQLTVTLQNVCPHKRVAPAAILTEVDNQGNEYNRGMKTVLVPAHTRTTCQNVTVRCIKFVLPESLDVSGSIGSICNTRNFKARFIAHYVDTDFECCHSVM